MASNSEFYKGKRKRSGPAFLLSFIAAAILALIILLFYALQKYIVISDSALRLDMPFLAAEGSSELSDGEGNTVKVFDRVDIELTVGETDYSNVKASAGEGLGAVKALYVPADKINADSINTAAQRLGDGSALMLELKPASGMLAYSSGVDIATGYGTTGTTELAPIISSLKDKELYLIAAISCCVDETLADRYPKLSLKTDKGAVYKDETGTWLDPYAPELRSYIAALCTELYGMGFDEIVLTNLRHPIPNGGTGFVYSGSTVGTPSPMSAVSGFALGVSRSLRTEKARLSVMINGADTVTNGKNEANGQNVELFYKIFDRVYCNCTTEGAAAEAEAAQRFAELGEAKYRFVPVCYGTAPDTECWVRTES